MTQIECMISEYLEGIQESTRGRILLKRKDTSQLQVINGEGGGGGGGEKKKNI